MTENQSNQIKEAMEKCFPAAKIKINKSADTLQNSVTATIQGAIDGELLQDLTELAPLGLSFSVYRSGTGLTIKYNSKYA